MALPQAGGHHRDGPARSIWPVDGNRALDRRAHGDKSEPKPCRITNSHALLTIDAVAIRICNFLSRAYHLPVSAALLGVGIYPKHHAPDSNSEGETPCILHRSCTQQFSESGPTTGSVKSHCLQPSLALLFTSPSGLSVIWASSIYRRRRQPS